ncbi:hypothetical protein BS50DRAFT_1560 [Corynespora cassiicola Philippines]|uniref:Uncharacterized protein n=1 Tax=Corynespora cassiicola Philippines TaxID=1448308 RepID=A0A2T2P8E9_CORCC|nr:hypothetical protein BS50DRAFT_1560 [Corynespora cassiicola Philippines]
MQRLASGCARTSTTQLENTGEQRHAPQDNPLHRRHKTPNTSQTPHTPKPISNHHPAPASPKKQKQNKPSRSPFPARFALEHGEPRTRPGVCISRTLGAFTNDDARPITCAPHGLCGNGTRMRTGTGTKEPPNAPQLHHAHAWPPLFMDRACQTCSSSGLFFFFAFVSLPATEMSRNVVFHVAIWGE